MVLVRHDKWYLLQNLAAIKSIFDHLYYSLAHYTLLRWPFLPYMSPSTSLRWPLQPPWGAPVNHLIFKILVWQHKWYLFRNLTPIKTTWDHPHYFLNHYTSLRCPFKPPLGDPLNLCEMALSTSVRCPLKSPDFHDISLAQWMKPCWQLKGLYASLFIKGSWASQTSRWWSLESPDF